jgi:hypothetical protein
MVHVFGWADFCERVATAFVEQSFVFCDSDRGSILAPTEGQKC